MTRRQLADHLAYNRLDCPKGEGSCEGAEWDIAGGLGLLFSHTCLFMKCTFFLIFFYIDKIY